MSSCTPITIRSCPADSPTPRSALYDQARGSGKFPAGAYMLTNPIEYFGMMASVYLHGSAARDPFTREAIEEKQPEFYQWMVKEFGPR